MPGEYQGEFFAKHGYDKLSWPKFIEVTRSRWKGNADKIEITQMLHANVIEGGEYCSVAAVLYLLRYYSLCGIKDDGPLFRKFHKDKKSGNMVPVEANFSVECKVGKGSSTYMKWYAEREEPLTANGFGIFDEEGKQVFKHSMAATLSSNEVTAKLMRFFKSASRQAALERGASDPRQRNNSSAVRLNAATSHSMRATMVGWAARSRSRNAYQEALLTGRWSVGSKVFDTYWRLGMAISEQYHGVSAQDDPIFQFKPWPIGGTTNSLSVRDSGVFGAGANVARANVRQRKEGGSLDEAGKKRQKVQRVRRTQVGAAFKQKAKEGKGKECME